MAQQSKTQIYLKIKKPLLERQRRERINNCLEALKKLVAELQADDAILRMDKAELLEQTLVFVRQQCARRSSSSSSSTNTTTGKAQQMSTDAFRHGYMNAVNEVSRVMASTPGMNVEWGKSVMVHLGRNYNRVQQQQQVSHCQQTKSPHVRALSIECSPLSPASSGYHSDCESPAVSPVAPPTISHVWRPW